MLCFLCQRVAGSEDCVENAGNERILKTHELNLNNFPEKTGKRNASGIGFELNGRHIEPWAGFYSTYARVSHLVVYLLSNVNGVKRTKDRKRISSGHNPKDVLQTSRRHPASTRIGVADIMPEMSLS